jgi:hypothetical protein
MHKEPKPSPSTEEDRAQIVWHGKANIEYGDWKPVGDAAPRPHAGKPAPKPKG